jgi:glycosyltransferase involved in cell wall biosynthesis
MKSPFRGWLDIRVIFKLRRIIKENNIGIIHMHLHRPIIFGTKAAKGIKKIATIHNQEPHQTPHNIFEYIVNRLENRSLKKCDYITTVSKAVKESIISCYGDLTDNNVKVIYNALNTFNYSENGLDIKTKYNLGENLIIASIGRLDIQKGIDYLIDAIELLEQKNIGNYKLLIIGEGNLECKLKEKVIKKHLKDKIIFTGYIKNVYSILDQIDIVVMPSIYEGFGLSLVEAMSKKICCIGTDVGGIPEVLGNSEIIVQSKNPIELSKVLEKMIINNDDRKRIGEELYRRYEEYFTFDKMINSYEKIYLS